MDKKEISDNVDKLMLMYKNGELGGEVMPEEVLNINQLIFILNYGYGAEMDLRR